MIARILAIAAVLSAVAAAPARAQNEQPIPAELRLEAGDVKSDCGQLSFKHLASCAVTLATDHPVHLAFGSLAPQNGFGLGGAFTHAMAPTEHWRPSFDADAVRAVGGAWRAGAYLTLRRTDVVAPVPVSPGAGTHVAPVDVHPIYKAYVQAISLPTVWSFGEGMDTPRDAKTVFAFKETILGASAIVPVDRQPSIDLAVVGEVNGRFVTIDDGLTDAPAFVQFGEGLRATPRLAGGHLALDYGVQFQEFVATEAASRFQRLSLDLRHVVPIGASTAPDASDARGPDACAVDATGHCDAPFRSGRVWNRSGAVTVRVFLSRSYAGDSAAVPFYFQPTIGGSDLNGVRALPSFDDYRFRGPHVVLFQQTFEHAIAGPVGAFVGLDEGRVSTRDEGLRFTGLKHSLSVGATIRAGAFPLVTLAVATGGGEGTHPLFTISASLLGGGGRPALF